MTEEELYKMPLNNLFNLMIIKIDELMVYVNHHDHKNMVEVQKEVEMLQRVIIAKRAAEMPAK